MIQNRALISPSAEVFISNAMAFFATREIKRFEAHRLDLLVRIGFKINLRFAHIVHDAPFCKLSLCYFFQDFKRIINE